MVLTLNQPPTPWQLFMRFLFLAIGAKEMSSTHCGVLLLKKATLLQRCPFLKGQSLGVNPFSKVIWMQEHSTTLLQRLSWHAGVPPSFKGISCKALPSSSMLLLCWCCHFPRLLWSFLWSAYTACSLLQSLPQWAFAFLQGLWFHKGMLFLFFGVVL